MFDLFYRDGSLWRVWRCDRVWRFFQSISITAFRGGLCVLASHPVTPSHLNKLNILKYILKIKFYSSSSILIRHSAILNPMNKNDKLLVIDPKLLIGSSIHSNDFNPITDEEDVWFWLFYREGYVYRRWLGGSLWLAENQSISKEQLLRELLK